MSLRISAGAIDAVQTTVRAVAAEYDHAATPPTPHISDALPVIGALGLLEAEWVQRLSLDRELFESIDLALGAAYAVIEATDSELAGFLNTTKVGGG